MLMNRRPGMILRSYNTTIRHSSSISFPRNSLISSLSPISTFWHKRFPTPFKYFSLILATAGTLRYIHPNTLITVGPPIAIGGWFLYKWFTKNQLYKKEIAKIYPNTLLEATDANNQILIQKYDETDINNVLNGIENEFDSFKSQLVPSLELKIIDYAILKKDSNHSNDSNPVLKLFNSSDSDQVTCKLGNDFDTFIVLPLREDYLPYNAYQKDVMEGTTDVVFDKFIKISIPLYSSKDMTNRKRLGTVEVYLLQHQEKEVDNKPEMEEEPPSQTGTLYNISVVISKYGVLSQNQKLYIRDFETGGLKKLNEKETFIDI